MSAVKEKPEINANNVGPQHELANLLSSPLPGQKENRNFVNSNREQLAPPPYTPSASVDPLAASGIRVPSSIAPEAKKLLSELITSGKATKEDVQRLLNEALDPGLRIQGTQYSTCGFAQLVRQLSANEFLKAASELALYGKTQFKGGEVVASNPTDPQTGMPYSGQATGKASPYGNPSRLLNLLTCSLSYTAMGSKEGEYKGAFARQLEKGFEIAEGKQHTVTYGAVGSVFFYARAQQGMQTTGSFRFAKDGDQHANHALTTQSIDGERVIYGNTWGAPKDTDPNLAGIQPHKSFTHEGPDGRQIVQGGESGRESLGLTDLANRTNFVVVDGAIDKVEITDELAKNLFGESKAATIARLEKIIEAQNAEGITNTELVKEGDKVFLRLKINDANFDDSGYPDPTEVAECAGQADLILEDVIIDAEIKEKKQSNLEVTEPDSKRDEEASSPVIGNGKILKGVPKIAAPEEEKRLPLPKKRFDVARQDEASQSTFADDRWKPNSSRDPNASPDNLFVKISKGGDRLSAPKEAA